MSAGRADIPYVDFATIRLPSGPLAARGLPPCRAVGRPRGLVVDATAGLGGDAFLLAVAGFEVLAVERHPEVFEALAAGLERAEADPKLSRWLGGRLRLRLADARDVLEELVDVSAVHVDPMFPEKRKTALPPKDIQQLRRLVGADEDAVELYRASTRYHFQDRQRYDQYLGLLALEAHLFRVPARAFEVQPFYVSTVF